ncbi:MAG: hypothetical protein LBS90_05135 [Oscillospiraceae bacterium]|nr:hypothetical protein [Oscillospiraceae bacterium]
MTETKSLYVVLSRSPTVLSRVIRTMTGDSYAHAALALDRNLEYMFSFGRRHVSNPFIGCFKRERLSETVHSTAHGLPGLVIELRVHPLQYGCAVGLIEKFLFDSDKYGYNYLGLLSCIRKYPRPHKRRFFCSEFVYYVLQRCGACDFQKPRGRVRPQDMLSLKGDVVFRGDLLDYARGREAAPSIFPPFAPAAAT